MLQIPKQSLADRQTDVEASKRESKVGATNDVCLFGLDPPLRFRPRRVKTQQLHICERRPLSVPGTQPQHAGADTKAAV